MNDWADNVARIAELSRDEEEVWEEDAVLEDIRSMPLADFVDCMADMLLCGKPRHEWDEHAATIQQCLIDWREMGGDENAAFTLISNFSESVEAYFNARK